MQCVPVSTSIIPVYKSTEHRFASVNFYTTKFQLLKVIKDTSLYLSCEIYVPHFLGICAFIESAAPSIESAVHKKCKEFVLSMASGITICKISGVTVCPVFGHFPAVSSDKPPFLSLQNTNGPSLEFLELIGANHPSTHMVSLHVAS